MRNSFYTDRSGFSVFIQVIPEEFRKFILYQDVGKSKTKGDGSMAYRKERDTLGEVSIPSDRLWGAQTQRSLENFKIGENRMPFPLISALALIKKCSAKVNSRHGLLPEEKALWIEKAAEEIEKGHLKDHFPLVVWQTGSGTQTNMNVNEVIANKAGELSGGVSVHPNDHVNLCQSSNDTFPSAMRIAALLMAKKQLLPALSRFETVLAEKSAAFQKTVKIGRTHLMDATPLTLGQEFSAFQEQIVCSKERVEGSLPRLLQLPLGGTAVGTGLNTFPEFGKEVCQEIAKQTGEDFQSASNKFEGQAAHDSLVQLSGSLKTLAVSLMKIGNDIRLLASGPRCGLNELILPANEPGSSIMPGKVNPTQCEALTMVCVQVMAQDLAVSLGGSLGQLQLNAFKPLIIFNVLNSLKLLSQAMDSFREKCLKGLEPNEEQIKTHLNRSLMLVTALNPHIGYEKAAQIAKQAFKKGTSLREEAVQLGFLTEEEFDTIVQPLNMTAPNLKGKN